MRFFLFLRGPTGRPEGACYVTEEGVGREGACCGGEREVPARLLGLVRTPAFARYNGL